MTLEELRAEHRYCAKCDQDTLPMRNGRCGFCDTRLVGTEPLALVQPRVVLCRWCGDGFPYVDHAGSPKEFCSPGCRSEDRNERRRQQRAAEREAAA